MIAGPAGDRKTKPGSLSKPSAGGASGAGAGGAGASGAAEGGDSKKGNFDSMFKKPMLPAKLAQQRALGYVIVSC